MANRKPKILRRFRKRGLARRLPNEMYSCPEAYATPVSNGRRFIASGIPGPLQRFSSPNSSPLPPAMHVILTMHYTWTNTAADPGYQCLFAMLNGLHLVDAVGDPAYAGNFNLCYGRYRVLSSSISVSFKAVDNLLDYAIGIVPRPDATAIASLHDFSSHLGAKMGFTSPDGNKEVVVLTESLQVDKFAPGAAYDADYTGVTGANPTRTLRWAIACAPGVAGQAANMRMDVKQCFEVVFFEPKLSVN